MTQQPQYDTVEQRGASLLQHGPANSRVYIMKLAPEDCPPLLDEAETLACEHGYGKIFAKTPTFAREAFLERGYRQEALVPNFYRGTEDAVFWAKFLDPARGEDPRQATLDEVLAAARGKQAPPETTAPAPPHAPGIECRPACPADAPAMAEVYKVVFETYPFPIHDPEYLVKTMSENIAYFVAFREGRMIAVSSAEMDEQGSNVEMTDFATLPECRGSGIASYLLGRMEAAMRERGIRTAFTIARALSFGMNITFAKLGYAYAGTLINNTGISGSIESMNIWHKPLG